MFAPDRYVAALRFAAERHNGQLVPDSDLPYLLHVTSVAGEVIANCVAPKVFVGWLTKPRNADDTADHVKLSEDLPHSVTFRPADWPAGLPMPDE